MKKLFIESRTFSDRLVQLLDDATYASVQQALMAEPEQGAVMKGCGGLRKLRVPDPKRGKGKRGGARVIYLHVPEVNRIYLVNIYTKDMKDDLSPQEKKAMTVLAQQLKTEALKHVT